MNIKLTYSFLLTALLFSSAPLYSAGYQIFSTLPKRGKIKELKTLLDSTKNPNRDELSQAIHLARGINEEPVYQSVENAWDINPASNVFDDSASAVLLPAIDEALKERDAITRMVDGNLPVDPKIIEAAKNAGVVLPEKLQPKGLARITELETENTQLKKDLAKYTKSSTKTPFGKQVANKLIEALPGGTPKYNYPSSKQPLEWIAELRHVIYNVVDHVNGLKGISKITTSPHLTIGASLATDLTDNIDAAIKAASAAPASAPAAAPIDTTSAVSGTTIQYSAKLQGESDQYKVNIFREITVETAKVLDSLYKTTFINNNTLTLEEKTQEKITDQLASFKTDFEQAQNNLAKAQTDIATAESQIKALQKIKGGTTSKADEQAMKDLAAKLVAAQGEIAKEQANHTATQDALTQEQAAHSVTQQKLAQEQTDHSDTQQQLAKEKTAHENTKQQLAQVKAALTQAQTDLSQEKTAHGTTRQELAQAQADLTQAQTDLNNQIDDLNKEILQQKKKAQEELKKEKDELNKDIDDLNKEILEKNAKIRKLTAAASNPLDAPKVKEALKEKEDEIEEQDAVLNYIAKLIDTYTGSAQDSQKLLELLQDIGKKVIASEDAPLMQAFATGPRQTRWS